MDNIELDKLPDESKYYIPTIEEFHVGFNYEIWEKKLVYDKVWKFRVNKYIFNEKQVTQTFFNYNFIEDLREGKIRVKLLDKEDIESLGWKRDSLRAYQLTRQIYNKDNWMLLYDSENHKLSLTVRDPSLNLEMMIKLRTTEVFNITIKNKSELIKLLKQLDIG